MKKLCLVALTGWYLIGPVIPEMGMGNRWVSYGAFDTARECEAERVDEIKTGIDALSHVEQEKPPVSPDVHQVSVDIFKADMAEVCVEMRPWN